MTSRCAVVYLHDPSLLQGIEHPLFLDSLTAPTEDAHETVSPDLPPRTHQEPLTIYCLAASICPARKCLISADTKCDAKSSAISARWESVTTPILFRCVLVMISNKAKVVDHCPKTPI